MNKPGAPRGNNNALKGDAPKLTRIQFRCTAGQKADFIQSAHAEGLQLTEWIINTLTSSNQSRPS